MKKILFRLFNLRDESGATMVIVAMAMVAMIGFTAIVIDGGRLYLEKSKLQKAMDAAALAGAQGLLVSEVYAEGIAEDVSTKNGYESIDEITAVYEDYIEVEKTVQVPMTFAKVLISGETVPVTASAKAEIGTLSKAHGIAPIAVEESALPAVGGLIDLVCTKEPLSSEEGDTGNGNGNGNDNGNGVGSGQPSPGNCGYLSLDGTGGYALGEAIKNGASFSTNQEYATTEPGTKWGQVKSAIDFLIQEDVDAGRDYCSNYKTADNSCKRVIEIVVIEKWDAEGRDQVKVVGFASFWLADFNPSNSSGKSIQGRFIRSVSQGEIDELTGGGGSWDKDELLFGVKLSS